MKIAVHGSHLCQEREDGNQTYIINLFKNLALIDSKNQYTFYYNRECNKKIEATNFHHNIYKAPVMWTQRVFPFLLKKDKPDLLFMPIQMLPFLKPKGLKSVVTIHDLAFLFYPETYPKKDLILHKLYVKEAIHKADHLIAISQATKDDVMKHYDVPDNKITVIYHGVNTDLFRPQTPDDSQFKQQVLKKYNITKPYLLYIGNVQPRKNIQGLVKAFQMIQEEQNLDIQLVIAGASAWLVNDVFKQIRMTEGKSDIIFTGRFETAELPVLLWGSSLFVLPSFYEGFGMPILEAFACGTPVAVADTPSLIEIAGDAGVSFNPKDPVDIKNTLLSVLQNEALSNQLIVKGNARVQRFSWQTCAQNTLKVLQNF